MKKIALFIGAALAVPVVLAGFEYAALKRALDAYDRGDYLRAANGLTGLLNDHPSSDILLYDAGTALYRTGDYVNASALLSRALRADNADLRAKAHYNLGNSLFRRAQHAASMHDRKAEESLLREASEHYREAAAIAALQEDARFNLSVSESRLAALAANSAGPDTAHRKDSRAPDTAPYAAERGKQNDTARMRGKKQPQERAVRDADFKRGPHADLVKKDHLTRQEAELLLEEYRRLEQQNASQVESRKAGHHDAVQKDW